MPVESQADYFDSIRQLVTYELWCNLQAVDLVASLPEHEYHRDFGFGLRTPHRTLFHIADVIRGWSGCVGPVIERPAWLPYDKNLSLQEIRSTFRQVGDSWLARMQESRERGLLDQERRLHQVFHLITHGSHHRGQLLSMITLMGFSQPFEGGDFGGWSKTAS